MITLDPAESTAENAQSAQGVPRHTARGTPTDNVGTREGGKEPREIGNKLAAEDDAMSRNGALASPHVRDSLELVYQDAQVTRYEVVVAAGWPRSSEKAANPRQPLRENVPPQPYREGLGSYLPLRPLEPLVTVHVGQTGTWYLMWDKRSVWFKVIGTPPMPEHPGLKDLVTPLREWFACFDTPIRLSSDGRLEFTLTVIANSLENDGMRHECPLEHGPGNKGSRESNVKTTKRLVQDDTGKGGSLNTSKLAAAPITSRNAHGQWHKALPAKAATRKRPGKTPPRIPTDTGARDSPAVGSIGRDPGPKKEATIRERYVRDWRDPPAKACPLPPISNTRVLTYGQTGKATPRWDETKKATATPSANQDVVEINGPTKSSRKPPGPRPLHSLDKGSNDEAESAWGARGHGDWSADPTNEPGRASPVKRIEAAVAMEEISRRRRSTGTTHPESIRETHAIPSSPLRVMNRAKHTCSSKTRGPVECFTRMLLSGITHVLTSSISNRPIV